MQDWVIVHTDATSLKSVGGQMEHPLTLKAISRKQRNLAEYTGIQVGYMRQDMSLMTT